MFNSLVALQIFPCLHLVALQSLSLFNSPRAPACLLLQEWLATPLSEIDGAALETAVARFNKQVYKMERGLEANKVSLWEK